MPEAGETASQILYSEQEVNPTSVVQTTSAQGIPAGLGGGSWTSLVQVPHRGSC